MGTFAETAIFNYHLLFAKQGKQTSVFCFCLYQTNGSLTFRCSICGKQMEVLFSISSVFRIYSSYIYIYMQRTELCIYSSVSNGKQKTEGQATFLNLFTVCSSCKGKFVVCSFVDEETQGSYPFANGLNELAHLYDQFFPSSQSKL
jgi:hypothetical protein